MFNLNRLSRRTVLRTIGGGLSAMLGASADDGVELYHEPPERAPTRRLQLRKDVLPRVSTDEWPVFEFGLVTEGKEGPTALETVRSAASCAFYLDETKIADLDDGWCDITESESGGVELWWQYSTKPLRPGNHLFEFEMSFSEAIRTRGNPNRVWEGTYRFENIFAVVPSPSHAQAAHPSGEAKTKFGKLTEGVEDVAWGGS